MSDNTVEKMILASGATAPRITPDDVQGVIIGEFYFTAYDGACGALDNGTRDGAKYAGDIEVPAALEPLKLLTFCVLTLCNGFTVTGESACASPENFRADIGREVARRMAVAKIWPLLGYALRDKLYREEVYAKDTARSPDDGTAPGDYRKNPVRYTEPAAESVAAQNRPQPDVWDEPVGRAKEDFSSSYHQSNLDIVRMEMVRLTIGAAGDKLNAAQVIETAKALAEFVVKG